MGGKHKAQRTKNNVRPSSSGRSAELLGSNVSSLVGFSSIKVGGYVPALPGSSDEIESNINPNFHLVLKKMNKKDAVTKLKALNEFASLCRESDSAAVKTVLPFWPRLYCVLATDTEHRVREAAHNAHKAVVSSVGRSIAPYLKQIAGAWFTSQYDTYPPAASAASASLQVAFSAHKLTEAIIFCQEEILNYITDNLISQTPQTLSNPKTTTIEEMEAKYQRVIVSSLHGYGFYLSKLPEEQLLKAEQLNKKLIENAKFWKFSKRPENIVRVAWFSAIVNLCQKAPFFVSNVKKQIVVAVFNSLDDTDSVVLPVVWEAALHILVTITDWWEHVNADKLVFPKLWKILKEGGSGCAGSIFPNMLPFLSKIPPHLVPDQQQFYSRFFSSLQDGIKHRNVQTSVIESEAVAECYMECLSYISMVHIQDELCDKLIAEQLLPVMELMLKDNKMQLFRRSFYNKLVNVLVQWSKQQKSPEVFSRLVRDVLNGTVSICCSIIDSCAYDKTQMDAILLAQADLISAFKYYQTHVQKKRLKVTFSEEKSSLDSDIISTDKSFDNFFDKTPVSFQFEANNFVKKMLEKYFGCLSSIETCKRFFVRQLAKVVEVFDSNDMFNFLLSFSDGDKSWNDFYKKYIAVWLSDKDVFVEDVSRLVFTLLKYVQSEEDKQFVLHSLSQTETKKVLEWCLKNENKNFSSVKHWLSSDKVDSVVLSVVQEAITVNHSDSDSENAYSIVKLCLKRTNDGSILIKYETVISTLSYLCENVKNYGITKEESIVNLDNVAGLIDACLCVFSEHLEERYEQHITDIISECFKFSLVNINLTVLDRIWQDSVYRLAMLKSSNTGLIGKLTLTCCRTIKHFITNRSNVTVDELRMAVRQCIKYLTSLGKCDSCSDSIDEFIDTLLKGFLFDEENQQHVYYVLKLCYCARVINGKLSLPSIQQVPDDVTTCNFGDVIFSDDDFIKQFVFSSLFSVLFLLQMFGLDESCYVSNDVCATSKSADIYDKDDFSNDECISVADFSLKNIELSNYTSYLADSVLRVAACRIFKENFSKSKQYFECNDEMKIMEKCTKELIQKLDKEGSKSVERELIQRGLNDVTGGVCAEAINILVSDFLDEENLKDALTEIVDQNKLAYSQSDILSSWLHQVFSVGTGLHVSEAEEQSRSSGCLVLLCCHLRKQSTLFDLTVSNIVANQVKHIIGLGKLTTFETDLSSCSPTEIHFGADVAELLNVVVENHSGLISELNGWDFTMVAVASWISNLRKLLSSSDPRHFSLLPVLHLLSCVCRLFKSISNYIISLEDGSQLKTEWNDVFRLDLHKTIVKIWADIADKFKYEVRQPVLLIVFDELAAIIDEIIDTNVFIDKSDLSYWLEICCRHLQSSVTDVQLTAFKLLIKLTPHLVASDSECDEANKGAGVDVSFKHIQDSLKHTQTIVDTMLSGFKLGDTCILEPFTDGYVYTRSYLLMWLFILEICDKADSQLRFMYTAWIKENHFLEYLMKSVFCLMPEEAVHGHEGSVKHVQDLFSNPPEFSSGFWSSKTLARLSCWTYYKLLGRLPAEVRQWWSKIDHKVATIVERLTTMFVSPLLCAKEMKAVRHEGKKFQNMTVHVHPAAREVVATYVVEESCTELVIQLPLNHPLGPTKVESGKCMVSTSQTRQWVMKLSLFLIHQNGSIWDALSLWKTLIDKKFEGVEECYICFAILHNVSLQLPRLTCQTCKKKFHNTCLYQWFTTSNKSTCPICRNLF